MRQNHEVRCDSQATVTRSNSDPIATPGNDACAYFCNVSCSRRAALLHLGAMVALAACSSDSPTSVPDVDAVTISGDLITVRLDRLDALRTVGSSYVISEQRVIVIRVADRDYRAFTNVCTHSGCGISIFQSPRMICQCHGSEYDLEGINVAGPAPLPLTRYAATLDTPGTTLRISLIP